MPLIWDHIPLFEGTRRVLASDRTCSRSSKLPLKEDDIGGLLIRIGFRVDYTIIIIRSPQNPILIMKAPKLPSRPGFFRIAPDFLKMGAIKI